MENFAQSQLELMNYNPRIHKVYMNINPEGNQENEMLPIFGKDSESNLVILFPNSQGYIRTVKDGKDIRPRYIKKFPSADEHEFKFETTDGINLFIPPMLDVKSKTEIKSLVICDDPVCAFILCQKEIPAIAIPGIQFLSDQNQIKNEVWNEIIEICENCSVKKLIYLLPNDTLDLVWKENVDLAIRPTRIFNSLWSIYTKVKHPLKLELYFAVPQKSLSGRRVSDMISTAEMLESIKSDLHGKGPSNGIVIMHDLDKLKMYDIKAIFGVQGGGAEFHAKYAAEIGLNRFTFNRSVYEFNFDEDKAVYIRSMESEQFICASGTYYQKLQKINRNGSKISVLEKFADDSFSKKFSYKSKDQIRTIKNDIPYFDSIDSKPSNTDYQEWWEHYDDNVGQTLRYYNAYHPILYKPRKGEFPITKQFIKHIFGDKEILYKGQKYNEYELGMDYCKLLYCKPEQFLPILCLVSEDRATGKTTFWDLQKEIYNNNVVHISNKDLMSQFTSMYAGKLIAVIEEAFLDKFEFTEKAKELVTAEYTKLERKGKDAFEVANFIKLGITSNKTKNFATVDDKEVRFWVRKLNPIVSDPDFKTKLFAEIPFFLKYLEEREYHTSRETRAWFATELIETQALKEVKQFSRTGHDLMISSSIKQYMINNRLTVCHLTLTDLRDLIQEKDLALRFIKTTLEVKYGKPEPLSKITYDLYQDDNLYENKCSMRSVRGFAYCFCISEFMNFDDIMKYYHEIKVSELLFMEEHENHDKKFWSKLDYEDLKLIPNFNRFNREAFDNSKSFLEYLEKTNEKIPF